MFDQDQLIYELALYDGILSFMFAAAGLELDGYVMRWSELDLIDDRDGMGFRSEFTGSQWVWRSLTHTAARQAA